MQRLTSTVVRNAVSNAVRGGASALVAIGLPHFLVHTLSPSRFNAWSLILQIAAYASFLDFGLQMAISRFLAQAIELDQRERRQRLIGTAFVLLSGAGVVAFFVIGFVILVMPRFFQGIPIPILSEVQLAALILATSASLLLPGSLFTGVLIGLHRNDLPAVVIGGTRLIGAAAVVALSYRTQSLVVLAACIAVANLAGGALQWLLAVRLLPGSARPEIHLNRPMARELLHYCAGLVVFSFSMLLVSGLDVTILGHFNFSEVGYYAIASLLVTFVIGLNNSVVSALMTPLAALQARQEFARIRAIVLASTRASIGAYIIGTGILFCFGPWLMRLWVGPRYGQLAYPIVQILMLAQLLRMIPSAYTMMLIATGQQMNAAGNSIFEAVVNLAASIVGAVFLGATGVALGTLIGAGAALVWVATWTIDKDHVLIISPRERLMTVLVPFACGLPVLIAWCLTRHLGQSKMSISIAAQTAALVASALLMLAFADLIPGELRERLRMRSI